MNWNVQRFICRRVRRAAILIGIAAAILSASQAFADDWLPISPDELHMTAEPNAPGAPAIYLYRQVDRDDNTNVHEVDYARLKILTEEGRSYGDIEIPYDKERASVHSIKARIIQPDGSIQNFTGQMYDKTVVKARGVRYLVKTFTLPNVQVGSIIEYRYTVDFREGWIYDSSWTLSSDLFTRRAKFSLKRYTRFAIKWNWPAGLPAGATIPKAEGDVVRMEAQDIPAFRVEDFMPPADQLKFRVDFIYFENRPETQPDKFWKAEGKRLDHRFESFVGHRGAMEAAVADIVSPSDPPEVKLRKIYARVQQIRNTSFELRKTEQEAKREKEKPPNNAEEVWKRGFGNGDLINVLFVALARAAGFEAYPVAASSRDRYFFNETLMNPYQLNSNLALVKLNGNDLYFDPGTVFAPFAVLPWEETGVAGLRLDKDGGSWIVTSLPDSSVTQIQRKLDLKLDPEGNLEGTATVSLTGIEALRLRMEERHEDDTDRKAVLEALMKESIPVGIEVELTNHPDWQGSAPALLAQYHLRVPGWVSGTGRRGFLALGLLGAQEKHLFEHAERLYPIYFRSAYLKTDDITIALPAGWKVDSLPKPIDHDAKGAEYQLRAESANGTLHITRLLRSNVTMVDASKYSALRQFFQTVRTGDEQQAVLLPSN